MILASTGSVSDFVMVTMVQLNLWVFISGRRRFDLGIYQRIPFISDPRVGFESTCSEDLIVIRSVDVPVMIVM